MGLEALMQGVQLSTGLEELTRQQLVDNIIGSVSGGGSGGGSGGSGMLNIDLESGLNTLAQLYNFYNENYGGGGNVGEVVVEEIVPTGYDENGNPTYD